MKVAITGHRPARIAGKEQEIKSWISEYLSTIDCTKAYSGMAQGTDQIFAKVVQYLGIPLICC